jgi:hypothetical protein
VFTYVAKRTDSEEHQRGKRYPITASGLRSQWKRDRKRAAKASPSILTFRFHDNRHTAGTRLLRHTGNLKMVQKLLNHARISTAAKYAHVLDDELLDAMDGMEDRDTKSRRKSRSGGDGSVQSIDLFCYTARAPTVWGLGVPSSNLGAPTIKSMG